MTIDPQHLCISEEVLQAISDKKPLVALESTIISHGMPFPRNLQTAVEMEELIRSHDVVPATCAIIEGRLCVGLSETQLMTLAQEKGVLKVARRDIAFACFKKLSGGTTVSATMMLAAAAGIKVFATGGIGGVHRGFANNPDVSADLFEFNRSPIAVVSAGAKAILDLNATLEYLESFGVPVIGYQTSIFPAFYYPNSGLRLQMQLDSALDIASFLQTHWGLDPNAGVLIANPIPSHSALSKESIESAINIALQNAQAEGVQGKELSPFLLSALYSITEGQSLTANKSLLQNNVRLGIEISKALVS